MKKIEIPVINMEHNSMYIVKGIVLSILFTLLSLLVFAAILTYTNLAETTIFPVIITISATSIFMGSSISTIKIKKHGLLNGSVIGGVYISLLYFISSMVHTGFSANSYTIIMIIASILAGMIGGIVGVNIR